MRLLVLGGTVFLSRAVAAEAVRRGHEVVCAARGVSGAVPEGARLVTWDRDHDVPDELGALEPDVVVDVTRLPSHARRAVAAWPDAHWVFVSTINVYAEERPGDGPDSQPLHEPQHDDQDPARGPEVYGAMKVACEQTVQAGTASSMVVRPGLIVGPGDPTGRYSYWPERLSWTRAGDPVLAPGDPADAVQVVDVRDLAAFVVDAGERRQTGVVDGIGPATPIGEVLAQTAAGVGADPEWIWVSQDFLTEHEVEPWMGERSVPLWLPRPEYDGMMQHDAEPAAEAGLTTRPLAETARDTLAWLRAEPGVAAAARTGLTAPEETTLLLAWTTAHRP